MTVTNLQIFFTIIGPIIILLSQKTKVVSLLSPVVCSYLLGILMANLPGLSLNTEVSKMATEASVPLAIPLLLFGTDFLRWFRLAKSTVLSFSLIVFSVNSGLTS